MSDRGGTLLRLAAVLLTATLIWGCEGDDGRDGATGAQGPEGPQGPQGPAGEDFSDDITVGNGSLLTEEEIERLGKLNATITGVTVASPPVVDFTVTDANGNPAMGIAEDVLAFTFAKLVPNTDPTINGGLPYWQSYLNQVEVDNPDTGDHVLPQAVEATSEGCAVDTLVEIADGEYQCTLTTDVVNVTDPIAVAWEPNLTHRMGMEIRLQGPGETPLAPDNPVFDFVPDGGAGSGVTREIADTLNCNGCHLELAQHGGPRKSVEYCVTCHNPGTVDQDTGESMDMAYLAHSIHMGEDRAVPFVVWGFTEIFGSGRFDASNITYPQAKTYCETCHEASMTHPDGDNWNADATAKTCGGCHAAGLVAQNFDPVTGQAEYLFDHAAAMADNGFSAVAEDGACGSCHLGNISTAGPPLAIHSRIRGDDRARAEAGDNFVFEILSATATGPGETPVVTFQVTDGQGNAYDILNDPEFDSANSAALNLYVQWATDAYYGGDETGLVLGARQLDDLSIEDIQTLTFRDSGYPYRMRLGAIKDAAVDNMDGTFSVTFFRALPMDITGDVAIGLGGHPGWEYTDADGVTDFDQAATVSAVFYPGDARQAAVDSAQCNTCHKRIMQHGRNRNGNIEICLLCHNGDTAVCDENPDINGACPDGVAQEGYGFGLMIHSIHTKSTTWLGGAFKDITYPQNAANCDTCHKAGTYNTARATARAVSTDQGSDIRVWTDDIATTATAAACGTCHSSSAAIGHFNTQGGQVDALKCTIVGAECGAPDGSSGSGLPNGQEACAVCHGPGSEFDTVKYHNPGVGE